MNDACPQHISIQHVGSTIVAEREFERKSKCVDLRFPDERHSEDREWHLAAKGTRAQPAGDDVKSWRILTSPIRHTEVEPHVCQDTGENETPRRRAFRTPVHAERSRLAFEDALGKCGPVERSKEQARDDLRGVHAPSARRCVVQLEELCDESGAKDEAHSVSAAIIPNAQGRLSPRPSRPLLDCGRQLEGRTSCGSTRPRVASDRVDRAGGKQGDVWKSAVLVCLCESTQSVHGCAIAACEHDDVDRATCDCASCFLEFFQAARGMHRRAAVFKG